MKTTTAYQCETCKNTYRLKSSAARHEKGCIDNPMTRACKTCAHNAIVPDDDYGTLRWCNAFDRVLLPARHCEKWVQK